MKNKRFRFIIITILLSTTASWALHPKEIENTEVDGIYLTLEDFRNNKLTIPTDKQHEGDKIKLNQFFISPEISVIEQDRKIVFYKDSIFAIKLNNGNSYRFLNNEPMLIADTSFLYIYAKESVKITYHRVGPNRRTKETPCVYYYYSLPGEKEVLKLTIENLQKDVLKAPSAFAAASNKFSNNELLYKFNNESKRFDINDFLLSLNRK